MSRINAISETMATLRRTTARALANALDIADDAYRERDAGPEVKRYIRERRSLIEFANAEVEKILSGTRMLLKAVPHQKRGDLAMVWVRSDNVFRQAKWLVASSYADCP